MWFTDIEHNINVLLIGIEWKQKGFFLTNQ